MKTLFKTALLAALLVLVLAGLDRAGAAPKAPPVEKVRAQAEEAVAVRARTQKLVDAAAARDEVLLTKIEGLEQRLKELKAQRAKTRQYIMDQRAKIAGIKKRIAEVDRMSFGLEPLLDQTRERLVRVVSDDLPFLPQEREARLDELSRALDDYDLALPEKARRLLAALAVEANYGHTVGVSEDEIDISGRISRVRLVRLGRLAVFALSADGKRAWRMDPQGRAFMPLEGWARALGVMAGIAQRKRVISLVEVPLGRRAQPGGGAK